MVNGKVSFGHIGGRLPGPAAAGQRVAGDRHVRLGAGAQPGAGGHLLRGDAGGADPVLAAGAHHRAPLSDVFSALALWNQHFPPFQAGSSTCATSSTTWWSPTWRCSPPPGCWRRGGGDEHASRWQQAPATLAFVGGAGAGLHRRADRWARAPAASPSGAVRTALVLGSIGWWRVARHGAAAAASARCCERWVLICYGVGFAGAGALLPSSRTWGRALLRRAPVAASPRSWRWCWRRSCRRCSSCALLPLALVEAVARGHGARAGAGDGPGARRAVLRAGAGLRARLRLRGHVRGHAGGT